MSSSSSNLTILLSLRSPILAPLYLAKIRGNAFRNIEFKYAFELNDDRELERISDPQKPKDLLALKVLSKSEEDRSYIAGVADPFRAIQIQTESAMYYTKIIAGIIPHQAFWLATDDNQLKPERIEDVTSRCSHIISQPNYTAGYAVIHDYLKKYLSVLPDETTLIPAPDGTRYSKISSDTTPGYERSYYRRFERIGRARRRRRCQAPPSYAYLTTDPSDHAGPLVRFLKVPEKTTLQGNQDNREDKCPLCKSALDNATSLQTEYGDTLMTALFAGNGWYIKHQTLFNDLADDILKAIASIYSDPIRAAVELKDYRKCSQDKYMSFDQASIPHPKLVEILEEMVDHRAYSTDIKIGKRQIERGVRLRPRIFENQKWKELKEEGTVKKIWEENVADNIRRKSPEERQPHICTGATPHWVREFISDHYKIIGGGKTVDKQPSLLFVAVTLTALALCLGLLDVEKDKLFRADAFASLPLEYLKLIQLALAVLSLLLVFSTMYNHHFANRRLSVRSAWKLAAMLSIDLWVLEWGSIEWFFKGDPSLGTMGTWLSMFGIYVNILAISLGSFLLSLRDQFAQLRDDVWIWLRQWRVRRKIRRLAVPLARVPVAPDSEEKMFQDPLVEIRRLLRWRKQSA